jgi:uncharacterized membrane-anchored protein YhcB (DUF1043 family)
MTEAIALIVGLIIGAGAIYFWQNSNITAKDKQLEQAKQKFERVEQDYESRMQQTISSLRKDYEEQSRQKIETFKKQYNSKIQELQQSHQTQIQSWEGSQANLSSLKQEYDRQIDEYEKQIKTYAEQVQEYEGQIQQLNEALSGSGEMPAIEANDSPDRDRGDRTYLSAQEQLSEEAMEELMQLLDDTPPRKSV